MCTVWDNLAPTLIKIPRGPLIAARPPVICCMNIVPHDRCDYIEIVYQDQLLATVTGELQATLVYCSPKA